MPVNGGRESWLMLRPIIGPNREIRLFCADGECPCLPEDGKRLVIEIADGCETCAGEIEEAATAHVRKAYDAAGEQMDADESREGED